MMRLGSKVALITGASSGIGKATAIELAKQGARVALAARGPELLHEVQMEIQKIGSEAIVYPMNVSNKDDWAGFVSKVIENWQKIDILINNAGIMPLSFIRNLRIDEWEEMIDVNLKGVLFGTAAVLPYMRSQGYGHIVNISSTAGRWLFDGGAVYCATKFAVNAFSEGFRQEITSTENIRMTLIEPGITATNLSHTIKDPDIKASSGNNTPIAPLQPSDIAAAVVYALTQPPHVNVNEILVMPAQQKI